VADVGQSGGLKLREEDGTHAEGGTERLDVRLVHARYAREGRAEERVGRFVDALADERRRAVLGLFVGRKVLARLICAVVYPRAV
jgi:hypothetical protein